MGLKTEQKIIGEGENAIEIRTTQLPAMRAQALMARLVRLVSPGLSRITMDTELDMNSIMPALAGLFGSLDEAEVASLTRAILASSAAVLDGKIVPLDRDDTINAAFAGKFTSMFGALRFALEVNYQDFFDGARAALATARKEKASAVPPNPPEASA